MNNFTPLVKTALYVFCFTIINVAFSQNPGNVSTDLELWLKANVGTDTTTSGDEITQWDDQSSNGFSAVSEADGPDYLEDGLNFNPTVAFSSTNGSGGLEQYLKMSYNDINPELDLDPRNDKLTFFTVFAADDADSEGALYSRGGSSTRNYVVWLGEVNRTVHYTGGMGSGTGNIGHHWGDETLDARYEPKIATGYVMDGTYGGSARHVYQSFVNGVFDDFPVENPGSNAGNAGIGTGHESNVDFLIGARRSGTNTGFGFLLHDAEIAEIIIYDRQLTTAEIQKVESYLAIKYGVTLGYNDSEASAYFGTSKDYILADGSTLAWEGTANAGYGYNVFGIARDDDSELLQLKSHSTNVQRIVSGSTTTIINSVLTIESESGSIADDESYLMTGNDGEDIVLQSSVVPERTTSTVTRKWKVRESSNDVGDVRMEFDLSQFTLSGPSDLELLVSDNESLINYKNYSGSYNASTQIMTYTGVDLGDNQYFTLGKVEEMQDDYHFNFDGTNYVDAGDKLDINGDFTISAWIKRGAGSLNTTIFSKRNVTFTRGYDLKIRSTGRLWLRWRNGAFIQIQSTVAIPENKWHHVAVTYNGTTATMYIDGVEDASANLISILDSTESFIIGAAGTTAPTELFRGDMDEVRVWNTALTEDQLHYMMNQEVENNSSIVRGSYFQSRGITPTKNDISGLSWSSLKGYFPFTRVRGNCVFNFSSNTTDNGRLYNTPTSFIENQTAPLPYKSVANSDWDNPSTWLNGSVQNIPGEGSAIVATKSVDWNIVEINHNVTLDSDSDLPSTNRGNRNVLGLFIDSNTLTLDGDNTAGTGFGLTVTHYLNLDGNIDLNGESQLIQTENSDFEVASSGRLDRDQQGTRDLYTYNYWSSPVGVTSTTANNTSYMLTDVLRNGTNPSSPNAITFLASGNDGAVSGSNISIADRWIWKFNNLPDDDYASWQHVRSTGIINAGEGYTMKGVDDTSGNVSLEQNYVFTGKPNNGTIELDLDANNDYLVGNPYPSAIDGRQFILDNGPQIAGTGSTTGSLYFWEHWGGGSHVLSEYQGGYATYNLAGGVPAAGIGTADPDVDQSSLIGTKTPGRYIPVSQGFFVVGETTGKIKFNNGQRVFQKEASGTSVFMEANEENMSFGVNTNNIEEESNPNFDPNIDDRTKLRIGLNSINTLHRQLLVTVDESATSGYDWGFDAIINEDQSDDMYWMIEDAKYVIQGIEEVNDYTILPLGIHTNMDGLNTITIDALENVSDDLQIFVYDKELDIYHDLRANDYEVFLNAGEYLNRFSITFTNQDALSLNENTIEVFDVNYTNSIESIVITNPNLQNIKALELFNILGQSIYSNDNLPTQSNTQVKVEDLATGTYVIKIETENNQIVTKKVLVK